MRAKFAFLLTLILLLTACSAGGSSSTAAPADGSTSAPPPTAVIQPTEGPSPTPLPPLAVLIIPADLNPDLSQTYQTTVYDLAQASGFRFQVLNKLSVDELALEPSLKIVVAFPPDPGIAQLAAAAPNTQFLAVNIPGLKAGGNVSTLGSNSTRIDQQAFIAGYIAATITEDYHTGVLLRKGSPDADVIRKAFRAGQEFFCGLCNPFAGPFEEYPLDMEIPDDAKPNEYSAYADYLIRKKVDTMFLQPEVAIQELEEYLSNIGVLVLGTQTPNKKLNGWVTTIQPHYLDALKAAWPELVAGNGGREFSAPIAFTDINEEFFTPGKQREAGQVLQDLLNGLISTGAQ